MGFALFFLAEYSNIILISSVTTLLFLGGWAPFFDFMPFTLVPETINFAVKTMFFITLFIIVRGTLPRYRYDQLMRLGWKVFLPVSLGFLLILSSILISFNCLIHIIK
jgi:NADH-quinone oxidoreductase subunit H